jgi:acetoin utilization protein AcuB
MLVRQWMTRRPVTVTPATSIMEARRLLRRHGIRHLPVVDGGTLVGIVSSRDLQVNDDLLLRALATLQSDLLTGRYRPVGSVMTADPLVAAPGDPVASAADAMVTLRIGALPVLDRHRLVGILSLDDCVRALLHAVARPAETPARPPARPASPPQPHAAPA